MEGSLVAYKVFTNGSVLQASEVNENLMQQSVATFSNAAARTAGITSPVEGQLTYLLDVARYDHWNGSAWISPFGITKLADASFSNAGSVAINNVFTSSYRNYLIVFNISVTFSTQAGITMNLSSGGTPNTTAANYFNTGFEQSFSNPTSIAGFGNNGANGAWSVGRNETRDIGTFVANIFDPHSSQITSFRSFYQDGNNAGQQGGIYNDVTSFDGFRINMANASTGIVTVYGLRN
jgi:hypothetical protein